MASLKNAIFKGGSRKTNNRGELGRGGVLEQFLDLRGRELRLTEN